MSLLAACCAATMPTSSASATLADLFSNARLSLRIPPSQSNGRSVVYFDEVLNVEAILALPSNPLLPIATTSSHEPRTSLTLPLPSQPSHTDFGHHTLPPYLNALLACLHVNLFTDYVPQHAQASAQYSKSTNPYEPLSTVQLQYGHLQLLPSHNPYSDSSPPQLAAVRAFSNSWAGNQPPKAHRTLKNASDDPVTSHHAHVTHDTRHWSVHWHCRVPINFIATSFPPLLSITAALTLRLDPNLLDQYIPTSSPRTFVRSGFAHSLLAPLHEGPVYPDESPVQSQARATASAALGLDGPNGLGSYLAHLPKDIVGGNNTIVTPRSCANALATIQQRRTDVPPADTIPYQPPSKPDSNGDLAALSSSTPSSTDHTPSSSSARGREGETQQQPAGLQIYKRSTREVLPLKTGINVRMRTLVTQHNPLIHRKPSSHRSPTDLEASRLVLSVELENPSESDSSFAVNDVQIKFDSSHSEENDTHPLVVTALQPLSSTLPIQLTRGSQYNLLFYVSVETDQAVQSTSSTINQAHLAREPRTRNVTITVSGRPEIEQECLPDFESQWNCALDLAPVLSDASKKSFIANAGQADKVNRAAPPVGPMAGNTQYSASSLRAAAAQYSDPNVHTARAEYEEDTRTPRPGHLGMGFPPPLRTSSAQHLTSVESPIELSEPTFVDQEGNFLQKARARAANRHLVGPWEENVAATIVRPWMSSSASSSNSAAAAASTGGLTVLSTLRPANARNTRHEGRIKFGSSLGDDGVVRPSVATGAKMLHPASIAPSTTDEKCVRVQTGDTVVVDLILLHKPPTHASATSATIRAVNLSWSSRPPFHSRPGALNDSLSTIKGKLMDADTARLISNHSAELAKSINGLIPVQDHVQIEGLMHAGQSRKVALELRCLSPGYHMVPPLKVSFEIGRGKEEVALDGMGGVHVMPAAVV